MGVGEGEEDEDERTCQIRICVATVVERIERAIRHRMYFINIR